MTVLRSTFKRIVNFWETAAGAMSPSAGFSFTRNYCPHCDEETEWQTSVLHRFYFCTRCRRDPKLSPSHYEAARREAQASTRERERVIDPAVEPAGRREAEREAVPA